MNPEEPNSDQKAQIDYDNWVAMLPITHGNDKLSLQCSANDFLGHNALKKITGGFGPWSGGWVDNVELDEFLRDRVSMHTYQETVASYAMAKSAFREARTARRNTSVAILLLFVLLIMNVIALSLFWIG